MSKYVSEINAKHTILSGYTGKGVGVAILDSGVSLHLELAGKITRFIDLINGRTRVYDDFGHGTHVAGIICGETVGVAKEAHIFVYKVLDENGNGDVENVMKALEDILNNRDVINVVNISFGFINKKNESEQRYIEKLLIDLWKAGVCVVCAAGNNGPGKSSITFPGDIPYVITVGSADLFSGVGPTDTCVMKPEILAPGRRILSLQNGVEGYCYKTGTSMAVPFVSGSIALALEKNPFLSCNKVKLLLYQTCTPVNEAPFSWGVLNVDKFMQMV